MDELFFALVGLASAGLIFLPLILAIVALSRTTNLRRRLAKLEQQLRSGEQAAVPTESSAVIAPEPAAEPVVVASQPAADSASPEPARVVAEEAVDGPAPVMAKAGIEERLTSRWLVWLGAVALVLSGVFLIKYAVDNALLSPAMRIGFGLLLAAALIIAGEWLRRRPEHQQFGAMKTDYVPGALTSAGLFIAFASVYGAYALFDLIGPGVTFVGLAAVALLAFALAALHSPIVAIIGLLAGFVTPMLIESSEPNAWILFFYLALIVAAAYAVVVYRGWGWLAFGATAGGLAWVFLWTVGMMRLQDLAVVSLFLAGLTGAALRLAQHLTPPDAPEVWQSPHRPDGPELNAWIAATGSIVLAVFATLAVDAMPGALAFAAPAAAALAYTGRRMERFDALMAHGAALLFAMLVAWDPAGILGQVLFDEATGSRILSPGSLVVPEAEGFVVLHLLCAAGVGVLGFFLMHGARRPAVWAGFSLLGAICILVSAYSRSRYFTLDLLWTLVATGSAALAVAATGVIVRRQARDWQARIATGFYAAAAVAGVSFAFAFTFREAWLTVALALQLPALAWIEKKLDLKDLRHIAHVLAAAVLVRLAVNPYVLSYEATQDLGHHWVIYGYGIPALAFYAAAVLFRPRDAARTVAILESGALVFALLLISLEIRILTEGRIAAPRLTLVEASLHSLVWLAAGWWRGRAWLVGGRSLDGWWSAVLCALGFATLVLGQLLALNPVATHEPVAGHVVFNVLIIAYLLPAILVAFMTRDLSGAFPHSQARVAGFALSVLLVLTWLTLETKRTFQGPALAFEAKSDAEYYAYSVVWLAFSFVLLGLGLWRGQAWLRHGALAILIVAVCKVFLLDMAALGGLYRVASFLGLGLCLVGIGYLYQRFVFTAARTRVAKA